MRHMNSARTRSLSGSDSPEDRQLTKRETEVMRCFAKRLLYKETAEKLGISFSMVNKHQHSIFRKLAGATIGRLVFAAGARQAVQHGCRDCLRQLLSPRWHLPGSEQGQEQI